MKKQFILGLIMLIGIVMLFVEQTAGAAVMAIAPLVSLEKSEIDKTLEQLAMEQTQKLNALVDPLLAKMSTFEKMPDSFKAELLETKTAFENQMKEFQKQVDALDIKLQKGAISGETDSFSGILLKTMNAEWVDNYKRNRAQKFEIKNMDLHAKVATVTRVADTIAPQFTNFVYDPARKFHVRSILPVGVTTSPTVWMPYESAITNAIARVAEAGAKPQSDMTPAVEKWAVEKIATHITFSEEIMEDMPQFISYLSSRWIELLKQAEDTKLLYGTGTNDIKGLTVTAQAYVDVLASSLVNYYDVLLAAVYQVKTNEFTPNYILINPADGLKVRTSKDTSGMPIFPFYTGNSAIMVGGVTVIETTAVTAGDFLVGDFAMGAQIFDRKSAEIRFFDQHASNATSNLITAVIEERLALVTFNAKAFVYGDFDSALAKGSA